MIGFWLFVLVVWDGLTRHALPPDWVLGRGLTVVILVVLWLLWLRRGGVRLPLAGAFIVGVLAAMTVGEVYYTCCGQGLSTWLIYAAVGWAQYKLHRDWRDDFAIAGLWMTGFVLLAVPGDTLSLGVLNRNMIAGQLLVFAPAIWEKAGCTQHRLAAFTQVFAVTMAIVLSGSRGALVAYLLASMIYIRVWNYITPPLIAGGGVIALLGLVAIRPFTLTVRFAWIQAVLDRWQAANPWFGFGPSFALYAVQLPDRILTLINAHNVYVTFLVRVGVIGSVIFGLAWLVLGDDPRRLRYRHWQWATLAVIAAHALVEENLAWWPVGIVGALVLASEEQADV